MAKADGALYVDYALLGRHIREARKNANMTQEILAEQMSLSIGHLGKIERGERMINLERLAEISVLVKLPIEKLIAGCVKKEAERISQTCFNEETIGAAIDTLLKGRSQKTLDLILTVCRDIIDGMEA